MDVTRGAATALSAEWRQYAGGPLAAVTGVTITITPLAGGAAVLGPTSTGVSTPSTGINAYVWTPSGALPLTQYLVTWSGTDEQTDVVTATEIITLVATAALGAAYATVAELKRRQAIPDTNTYVDADLEDALTSASRQVDRYCGRTFGRIEVADASARTFEVTQSGIQTDDFWTSDGLIVNGTAWTDLETRATLQPFNGVLDGLEGWPYLRIAISGMWSSAFISGAWTGTCVVTAAWGWEAVPADVKSATLMLAAEELKLKDTPFGVAGFGDYAIRVRSNPKVAERLAPYRVRVGMAG